MQEAQHHPSVPGPDVHKPVAIPGQLAKEAAVSSLVMPA